MVPARRAQARTAAFPYASSYPNAFPAIQLNNTDMGGPSKQTTVANSTLPFMFPFGGFARIGDVLQVPTSAPTCW